MLKRADREEWADVLRGIAVFMVVLGHLYKGYPYHLIVNPVKMPAFYFIAGYVESLNRPIRQVVLNRARTLFIPMIVFSLFPIRVLYYSLVLRDITVFNTYIMGFINGSINWFVYSFFLSSILFVCLHKAFKGNHLLFGMGSILCFVIGILTKEVPFMKIWSFNTALTSILFMYVGHELRIHKWGVTKNIWVACICLIVFTLLIWTSKIFYFEEMINFHLCQYYSVPICIALIFSGLVFLRFGISTLCSRSNGFLKEFLVSFGQNTLVVYLASTTFNAIVLRLFRRFLGTDSPSFLVCFVGAVISCLLGYLLSVFSKKYIPVFLGIWGTSKNHK